MEQPASFNYDRDAFISYRPYFFIANVVRGIPYCYVRNCVAQEKLTATMSRVYSKKMDNRKKRPHRKEKPKLTKTNIHISSEYHQEKAGYPRIRRKRKCTSTQDPQDRLSIFQHQIMLNERAIQARCEIHKRARSLSEKARHHWRAT
jgi:hypothetical protein